MPALQPARLRGGSVRHRQPQRAIFQYGAMATVPLMPSFVRGLINLRRSVRRDLIRAMGKRGNRLVIILEPDCAFDVDVDEMASMCEA